MSIETNNKLVGKLGLSNIKGSGISVKGETGNGIDKIEKTNSVGLIDTYTIYFTDGNTTTFTITNGKNGIDGVNGTNGENGKSLQFNWNGTQLGIRTEGSTEYIYVDLKGNKGDKGDKGDPGEVTLEQLNNATKTTQTTEVSEELTINNCAGVKGKLDIKSGKSEQATRSGKNLLNIPSFTNGEREGINFTAKYNESGSLEYINAVGNSTTGYRDIMRVNISSLPAGNYILSGLNTNSVVRFVLLKAGDTNAKKLENSGEVSFTQDSSSPYTILRIDIYQTGAIDCRMTPMIRLATITDNTFEPYGVMPSPDYPSTIRNVGDNINLLEKLTNGKVPSLSTGLDVSLNTGCSSDYINVDISEHYILNFILNSGISTPNSYILAYDKDNNYLGQIGKPTNYTNVDTLFTNYPTTAKVRLRIDTTTQNFTKAKFERGKVATSYSEYGCGSADFKVENEDKTQSKIKSFQFTEGQRLHIGDYLASDGIHQKRDTYIFTGTENWYKGNAPVEGTIHFYVGKSSSLKLICNCTHFVTTKTINGIALDNFMNFYPSTELGLTTVEQWKSYLAEQYSNGTPVTIEYDLAEEIVIPYTPEQEEAYYELQHLLMYEGYTKIECIDEIKPDIQLTYLYNNELNKSYGERFDKVEDSINELEKGEIYSTEEQVIGKWIDGKPLYRKVFTSKTSTSINKEKLIEFADNVREIISVEGNVILKADTNTKLPINMYVSSDYTILTYYDIINKKGRCRITVNNSDCTNKDVIFIVEYTKTTN